MENERETATFKRVSDFEIMGFQPKLVKIISLCANSSIPDSNKKGKQQTEKQQNFAHKKRWGLK